MIENINSAKAMVAMVIACLTALWGWIGWLVLAWAVCMGVDFATGYGAAMKNGEWSSDKCREGRWHKFGCFIVVVVAFVLDLLIGYIWDNIPGLIMPFQYSVLFAPLVIAWYVLMEMGSILENVGKLGAPMPAFLKKAIAVLKDATEKTGDEGTNERDE